MIGFKVIGEMSRDDLIEELLAHQRESAIKQTTDDLKKLIISMRMHDVHRRLITEARLGIDTLWGVLNDGSDEE